MFRFPMPYVPNSSDRSLSSFWTDCPDNIQNPAIGLADGDDFSVMPWIDCTSAASGAWGRYGFYGYAGATDLDAGIAGGGLSIGADGDNEGFALIPNVGGWKIATTTKKLWFEARIATSTITDTKHNFFVGLMEPVTPTTALPITTGDALADKNLIGFWRQADATSGNGAKLQVGYKNSGQTVQAPITNLATLVAATYVKVGFKWDPERPAAKAITFYVNGVEYSTTYLTQTNMAAVTFPNDTFLGFCFGVMNATASTPGTSSIDWWACAQLI